MKRTGSSFPKTCNCCGDVIQSRQAWQELALAGIQDLSGAGLPDLEYRHHPCGSTLAVRAEPTGRFTEQG